MDKVLYKDWLLKMKNKLKANDSYMSINFFKMSYIQSLVSNNALAKISTYIGDNATQLFTTAKKILNVLIARFNNFNEKKKARSVYKFLRQSTKEFSFF